MKSIIHPESSVWKQYAAAGLLFLILASVVIGKALLLDNCMAFDASDDLNHTFTGLHFAKQLLAKGAMPYFNYYNNFGTPLMGDALTYPFALQALPFYFTDISNYPLVATVNKFVLCVATLTALLAFYRTFNLSVFASAMAAMCVFFNFGFFWHFAHHHYQATVLFAVCIFTFQRISIRKHDYTLLFFSVALLSALMIYSVSANLIMLCLVFFLLQPFFYRASRKALLLNTLALATGGVLGSFQIIATALAVMNSVRSAKSYVDVFYIKFTSFELLLRTLFQYKPAGVDIGHIYQVVYFPVCIALAYLAGLYLFYRDNNKSTFFVSLGLGGVPVLLTGLVLVNPGLWKALPLLKATDITRILWIAMIFVGIGIGNGIDAIRERALTRRQSLVLVLVMTMAAAVCTLFVMTHKTSPLYAPGYWLGSILLILSLVRSYLNERLIKVPRSKLLHWRLISGVIILIAVVITYCPIVYVLGGWSSPALCASVNYFSDPSRNDPDLGLKVKRLSENGRFAIKTNSNQGIELVAETFARHGGGGRSIAMDGNLQALLLSKGMIENDDPLGGYHFAVPWNMSIASLLGLRYFGTPNAERHDNWHLIEQWGDFYIYENSQKPSIIYLTDAQGRITFVEAFRIEGNDIIVELPKNIDGMRLHVTITARPGFTVYVDGKEQAIGVDGFGFMSVDLAPLNKILRVSYNPLDFNWLFSRHAK